MSDRPQVRAAGAALSQIAVVKGVTRSERTRRRDAVNNRRRILRAALVTFRDAGLGATMTEVARRAGVAPATVYRQFGSRRRLLDAAARAVGSTAQRRDTVARRAVNEWEALEIALRRIAGQQAAAWRCSPQYKAEAGDLVDQHYLATRNHLAQLLERAQQVGAVRADIGVGDVMLLVRAVDAAVTDSGSDRDAHATAQRLVTHFVRSFRSEGR